MESITDSTDRNLSTLQETEDREAWGAADQCHKESVTTKRLNNNNKTGS